MIPEKIQNILFAAAIIAVMYFCFTSLARQFDPQEVIAESRQTDYTKQSYEDKERELADCNVKLQLADEYLMSIARPKGLTQ